MLPNPIAPYPLDAVWSAFPLTSPNSQFLLTPAFLQRISTGATFNKPVAYCVVDDCGFTNYKKGSVSASLADSDANCNRFPTFSGSLKVTVPADATVAEINAFIDLLRNQVSGALNQTTCTNIQGNGTGTNPTGGN